MALDLDLWAQINMFGHVSYGDYLEMEPDEAMACFLALKKVIDRQQAQGADADIVKNFEQHAAKYGG